SKSVSIITKNKNYQNVKNYSQSMFNNRNFFENNLILNKNIEDTNHNYKSIQKAPLTQINEIPVSTNDSISLNNIETNFVNPKSNNEVVISNNFNENNLEKLKTTLDSKDDNEVNS